MSGAASIFEFYQASQKFKSGDIKGGIADSGMAGLGAISAIPGFGIVGSVGLGAGQFIQSGYDKAFAAEAVQTQSEAALRKQTKERIKKARTPLQKQLAIANESGVLPREYKSLKALKDAALEENLEFHRLNPPEPPAPMQEVSASQEKLSQENRKENLFDSPSVQDWIVKAIEYQKSLGNNISSLDASQTTQLARNVIAQNEKYVRDALNSKDKKLSPEHVLGLGDAYKASLRQINEQGKFPENNYAHGFVPNFAGGESLARKTERRLTGSAIRSFDPRVGTYYRSAGQPASLDSLIRRDHPEGLSQAIKGSYSAQNGGTPNFAENSRVTDAVDGLVSKLDQLISTLSQEGQAEQTTQQIQAGDVNVPLDIGGITINTNMESLMAEFTNQLGQVREEFSRKINAIPGSQNVKAKVPN